MLHAYHGVCGHRSPTTIIAPRERLRAIEVERLLERVPAAITLASLALVVASHEAHLVQESFEVVDVHPYLVTIKPVSTPLAGHSAAEQLPRITDRLVEALAASLWILTRPDGFENLIALCALAPEREESDLKL